MPNQAYFPTKESEQVTWLNNYLGKITVHFATLGISSELTQTQTDLDCAVFLLETWTPAIQQDSKEATAYKRLVLDSPAISGSSVALPAATTFVAPTMAAPGIFARLFQQVQRIKTNPAYTPAMGADLMIVGASDGSSHPTPVFTAKVEDAPGGQVVRLKFTKFGHDGVYIQVRRNGGAWALLAVDMVTPYIDNQPLLTPATPETREYRMSFWDAGDPNGDWTDVAKVTVAG